MSKFYITTPIYYPNAVPHLGTAYATIMTDVFARYHRMFGDETLFLTGLDEHGQKIQQTASDKGISPQELVDTMTTSFKAAWKELSIDYDIFFKTTDEFHKKAVQKTLQDLKDKGEIYEDTYEGWYSVSEEIFLTEKDLVNGKSPLGREVTKITEKNYFFRMSKYQTQLIEYIEKNPNFIQPQSRKNEVLGFLRQPLADLCISRPKARLHWGVELPFDKDFVTYVWFDALLNYATAIGYQQKEHAAKFEAWWPHVHHVLGKDILTTHAVYWTTMLMALQIPMPKTIFAHGWILNKESEKMSKSTGDVVNPLYLKQKFGEDALRYYFVRDVHFGNDAPFSVDLLVGRLNVDLANNLGNLLSRTSQLFDKYFGGQAVGLTGTDTASMDLQKLAMGVADEVQKDILNWNSSHALEKISLMLTAANKLLEDTAPWKKAKENLDEAGQNLQSALECVRIAAILLQPVMPTKCAELLERIGCTGQKFSDAKIWPGVKKGTAIKKADPLFPRLDLAKMEL